MNLLNFQDILDFCQAEAIANRLSPTEESVYRSICREYSEKFHTPLSMVLQMDPEHVVLNVYEYQLELIDSDNVENLEKMVDTIKAIENPDYEKDRNQKLEEDIARYEAEEEERIRLGKPIHPSLAKKKPVEVPSQLPKSGGVDLSYLDDEES